MRLLRAYIDGYRNLKNVEVQFDPKSLTTVVIGENGSGKSNLIEAIVAAFKAIEIQKGNPGFNYELEYILRGQEIHAINIDGNFTLYAGSGYDVTPRLTKYKIPLSRVDEFLPDLIFGYYSGAGRRLEQLFDHHQRRYYDVINKEGGEERYEAARLARRLFYCRPIHGVLALIAEFAKHGMHGNVSELLGTNLKITGFHSALAHLKEPSWFNRSGWLKSHLRGATPGHGITTGTPTSDIWGAHGPAGTCARALRAAAFHPLELEGSVVEEYRRKPSKEAQLACFLRDEKALKRFATNYKTDQDLFAALEAMDISDLIREMIVWVKREKDESGDISFSDLSDGERQLLMVLGLIRVSRGKEALFLLDEPDTHLNPAWQLTYLDLIREWTEVAADEDKCQIIMTTHNPLTIAALEAKEVRVMSSDDEGNVSVAPPRIDPKGLGFAGVLTDIFGLSSSLDKPTQEKIDRRNELAREKELDPAMAKEFAEIKEELRHLGFLYEERDKLYSEFLKQMDSVKLADIEPLTPDELREREKETRRIVEELLGKK